MSRAPLTRNLRAVYCLTVFGVVTVGLTAIGLVGLSVNRSKEKRLRWRNTCFRRWGRAMASLVGLRLRMTGKPPAAPALLVSNHLSYLDILTLSLQMDCAFVSKNDVADWPLIGFAARRSRTIFIDRQSNRSLREALTAIEQALADGLSVVLFPEGTTSRGVDVPPFRSSLLELAARKNLPVHYASLHYRTGTEDPPADQVVCWWGDVPFFSHFFNLFRLHGFEAWITFGPEPIRSSDRKRLAQDLHRAVENHFIPSSGNLTPTTRN